MDAPVKNTKVYEQVIEKIKEMIVSGKLKKGDKLPPERELVDQLQASRASIREALKALQIIGLIESRQGGGNYIRESFEGSLFEPLSIMFSLQNSRPEEILELRKIIEVETAALAAKNINDEELTEIKGIIDQINESYDEELNAKLDKELHYKIANASGNFLVVVILTAVSSLVDSFIKDARKLILTQIENREILIEHHENLYNALLEHNKGRAAEVMRKHLDFVNEYLTSK
ncbi:FadR family transcriptional regulator [Clostridium sp. YIM B02515]|uniref:FadR family transcriptional regulator n=1 Tax=Clostridium rhizosphaerae TaxID=2803861 RepID=A0ABS1TJZ8_9CLOT|nr:FadR/GntR family transcriptional regulator [Clostridium rhizosphaerae]MBL4938288.1 FadR family transcriptional regulator [Clostridium rhizosphaerae]